MSVGGAPQRCSSRDSVKGLVVVSDNANTDKLVFRHLVDETQVRPTSWWSPSFSGIVTYLMLRGGVAGNGSSLTYCVCVMCV